MKESDECNNIMMELGRDLKTWKFQTHKPNTTKCYYVENTERLNGDTMSFWKQGDCGYTTNLNEAVTLEENHSIIQNIIKEQKNGIKKFRLWDVVYLRRMAILSVNVETIDLDKEVKL